MINPGSSAAAAPHAQSRPAPAPEPQSNLDSEGPRCRCDDSIPDSLLLALATEICTAQTAEEATKALSAAPSGVAASPIPVSTSPRSTVEHDEPWKARELDLEALSAALCGRGCGAPIRESYKRNIASAAAQLSTELDTLQLNWDTNGPMARGITAAEAIERLNKFENAFAKIKHKEEMNGVARRTLFFGSRFSDEYEAYHRAMEAHEGRNWRPINECPEYIRTAKEIQFLRRIYDLYIEFVRTICECRDALWTDDEVHFDGVTEKILAALDNSQKAMKKLPRAVRELDAYDQLRTIWETIWESLWDLANMTTTAEQQSALLPRPGCRPPAFLCIEVPSSTVVDSTHAVGDLRHRAATVPAHASQQNQLSGTLSTRSPRLLLHHAAAFGCPGAVLATVLTANEAAAGVCDALGKLPLQLAMEAKCCGGAGLQELYRVSPPSVFIDLQTCADWIGTVAQTKADVAMALAMAKDAAVTVLPATLDDMWRETVKVGDTVGVLLSEQEPEMQNCPSCPQQGQTMFARGNEFSADAKSNAASSGPLSSDVRLGVVVAIVAVAPRTYIFSVQRNDVADGTERFYLPSDLSLPQTQGPHLLHRVAALARPFPVVEAVLLANTQAATIKDEKGKLPIQLAVEAHCSVETFDLLWDSMGAQESTTWAIGFLLGVHTDELASTKAELQQQLARTLVNQPQSKWDNPARMALYQRLLDSDAYELLSSLPGVMAAIAVSETANDAAIAMSQRSCDVAAQLLPTMVSNKCRLCGGAARYVSAPSCTGYAATPCGRRSNFFSINPPDKTEERAKATWDVSEQRDSAIADCECRAAVFEDRYHSTNLDRRIRSRFAAGQLLLHYAIMCRRPAAVLSTVLAANPAAVTVENEDGQLPVQLALEFGHCDAVELILRACPELLRRQNILDTFIEFLHGSFQTEADIRKLKALPLYLDRAFISTSNAIALETDFERCADLSATPESAGLHVARPLACQRAFEDTLDDRGADITFMLWNQDVCWSSSFVTDEDVMHLAEALEGPVGSVVRVVHLNCNLGVTDVGAARLAAAVKRRGCQVRAVELLYTSVGAAARAAVHEAIEMRLATAQDMAGYSWPPCVYWEDDQQIKTAVDACKGALSARLEEDLELCRAYQRLAFARPARDELVASINHDIVVAVCAVLPEPLHHVVCRTIEVERRKRCPLAVDTEVFEPVRMLRSPCLSTRMQRLLTILEESVAPHTRPLTPAQAISHLEDQMAMRTESHQRRAELGRIYRLTDQKLLECSRVSKALMMESSAWEAKAEKFKSWLGDFYNASTSYQRTVVSTHRWYAGWSSNAMYQRCRPCSRRFSSTFILSSSSKEFELMEAKLDQCQKDLDSLQREFNMCMAEKQELHDKSDQVKREIDEWESTNARFLWHRQWLAKRLKGQHGELAEILAGFVRILCASVDGVPVVRGSCRDQSTSTKAGPTCVNTGMTLTQESRTRKPAEMVDTECPTDTTQVASLTNDCDECCEVLHRWKITDRDGCGALRADHMCACRSFLLALFWSSVSSILFEYLFSKVSLRSS